MRGNRADERAHSGTRLSRDHVGAERDDHEEKAGQRGCARADDKVEVVPGLELLGQMVDHHCHRDASWRKQGHYLRKSPMAEERRVVTILFSDVAGSTAIGESNDPEDVRALLGRYYAIAREVIAAHGGTLEKFIGDSVMAVFGIPQAHGDDAERALVAALALREAVAGDPLTAGPALRISGDAREGGA